MSKLKQVIEFESVERLNRWLSDRLNDKYETDIHVAPVGDYGWQYVVIYWENKES